MFSPLLPRARLLAVTRRRSARLDRPAPREMPSPRTESVWDLLAPRSECEWDLLATLWSLAGNSGRRFVRSDIETQMDLLRLGPHGGSTIGIALSVLVKRGLLTNGHDRRGYALGTIAPDILAEVKKRLAHIPPSVLVELQSVTRTRDCRLPEGQS
jgi:hypothetical protein